MRIRRRVSVPHRLPTTAEIALSIGISNFFCCCCERRELFYFPFFHIWPSDSGGGRVIARKHHDTWEPVPPFIFASERSIFFVLLATPTEMLQQRGTAAANPSTLLYSFCVCALLLLCVFLSLSFLLFPQRPNYHSAEDFLLARRETHTHTTFGIV